MRYADLFAGIGGFRLALDRAGHECVFGAEIEPFPRSVYAAHFGELEHDDVTQLQPADFEGLDLVAGGFPCQDASAAGKGLGLLHGRRSGLVFRVVACAAKARAKWLFLENVRGLLVRGRGFGELLGVLSRLGYGWAYRTLDAQYFGVAQRRRRVFLVAGRGVAPERCGAVLLEPPRLCGDPPARRAPGEDTARGARFRPRAEGFYGDTAGTVAAKWQEGTGGPSGDEHQNLTWGVIPFSKAQVTHPENRARCDPGSPAGCLAKSGEPEHVAHPLGAWVRRLTPLECERLQGFPDGWTDVPGAKDGKRYKALGNSVAVPCVEWIAHRLAEAERRGW